jgi:general secretion pathway protein A
MYKDFYGLIELPFGLTPDPGFVYYSPIHREALAQMICGIKMKRGFAAITGEVGTGKTTLIHALLKQLDENTETAYLFHAILGTRGLFQSIFQQFGLPVDPRETKTDLLLRLNDFLMLVNKGGGNVVLIIDEAQNLKPHILEEIRLISNMETTRSKLIQILLVGQPEFDYMLDRQEVRQLKQRIAMRFHLSKLNRIETEDYIYHRLRVAGQQSPENIFTPEAVDEIYAYTMGLPRSINVLCDNALIMGYATEAPYITAEIVKKVKFKDVINEMGNVKKTTSDSLIFKNSQTQQIAVGNLQPAILNSSTYNVAGGISISGSNAPFFNQINRVNYCFNPLT